MIKNFNDHNLSCLNLNQNNLHCLPTGTSRSAGIIIGIILGVFVAVAVGAVIVVGVVVWMCRRHRRGQGKNHELQVGLQDINSHKNEDVRHSLA